MYLTFLKSVLDTCFESELDDDTFLLYLTLTFVLCLYFDLDPNICLVSVLDPDTFLVSVLDPDTFLVSGLDPDTSLYLDLTLTLPCIWTGR
jgi:hypothetical protein